MDKRRLGRSGIAVSPLIFGGNVFGWTVDEATSFDLLDAFVDGGFEGIDTADMYSRWKSGNQGGESETIIGRWMKARGNRGRVVIATKCGMEMGPGKSGLSRRYIVEAVEHSLKRLQTDVIDLYQSHQDDPDTPIEETLEAHASLLAAGKVRAIGASNFSAARLGQALVVSARKGIPRYETLQPNYSLASRGTFEGDLQALCVKEGLGVIPYYSLASGFLTGKYRKDADTAGKARGGGVHKHMTPRGFAILAALDEVARQHAATPAQVALAWLLAQPAIAAPIASATTRAQLTEILGGPRLKLDAAALAKLDAASS